MIVTGHINFFDIFECGLYRSGGAKPHGCEITETFDLIAEWVKGKHLIDTISWDPASSRTNTPKCYCRDIYKDESTGEYLLVLWKSDVDSAGTLWGAREADATGEGEVVKYTNNYKGSKVVWGRPCYYWVIPRLRTIASIKFDHSVCDSQMMQDWVIRCINNKVEHPKKTKRLTETGQVRLCFEDTQGGGSQSYAYRFDVRLRSLNTASAEMRDLASRITHIVRRETVRLATELPSIFRLPTHRHYAANSFSC